MIGIRRRRRTPIELRGKKIQELHKEIFTGWQSLYPIIPARIKLPANLAPYGKEGYLEFDFYKDDLDSQQMLNLVHTRPFIEEVFTKAATVARSMISDIPEVALAYIDDKYNISQYLSNIKGLGTISENLNQVLSNIVLTYTGFLSKNVGESMKNCSLEWPIIFGSNPNIKCILRVSYYNGHSYGNLSASISTHYSTLALLNIGKIINVVNKIDSYIKELREMS